jgi:hypothetical protein
MSPFILTTSGRFWPYSKTLYRGERLAKDEHNSLFVKSINDEGKSFATRDKVDVT